MKKEIVELEEQEKALSDARDAAILPIGNLVHDSVVVSDDEVLYFSLSGPNEHMLVGKRGVTVPLESKPNCTDATGPDSHQRRNRSSQIGMFVACPCNTADNTKRAFCTLCGSHNSVVRRKDAGGSASDGPPPLAL
jgi:hypothetical protein